MEMTTALVREPVGEKIRVWRERRRLSQLNLAMQAEVSARHLSFVETGRSVPSRGMVLRLAAQLDVPLRERNDLLLAAGYAPVYSHTAMESPQMAAVRAALHQVLTGHDPYPAMAVDRAWNLVEVNTGFDLFTESIAAELLEPPVNVLRLTLHPLGLAPRIVNLAEWRAYLLHRLRYRIDQSADPVLAELYKELSDYPCDGAPLKFGSADPGAGIVMPMRLRAGRRELALFSTVAMFGTPLDVTVSELAVKSFFPADAATKDYLISRHSSAGPLDDPDTQHPANAVPRESEESSA